MFKIGDFSKLSQVTVKALRHYDRIGLLKPARGRGERLPLLLRGATAPPQPHRGAQGLGLTLEQIRTLLDEEVSGEQLRGMLKMKRLELEAEMNEKGRFLERVEARLRQIEREDQMSDYEVVLKKVESIRVASIREVATGGTIGSLYGEVLKHLAAQGVEPSGPQIAVQYKMFSDRSFDVDTAVPISRGVQGNDRIKIWWLPVLEAAACTVHEGDYSDIGQAYGAMLRWLEANRYTVAGPVRAVYLKFGEDRLGQNSPTITELQLPVVEV